MPIPIGNASGYGTQDRGSMPTPFEAMARQASMNSSMQLMQWAAMTDPRVQAASQLGAQIFTGRDWNKDTGEDYYKYKGQSSEEFLKSELGQTLQMGIATASMHGGLGGGSIGQFAFGAQQMMGNTGFRMNTPEGTGQFFGQGFATDMSAANLMSELRGQMMSPVTGLPKSANSLNYSEMGEMMYEFGKRGIFAGETVNLEKYGTEESLNKRVNELRNNKQDALADQLEQMGVGAHELRFDEGTLRRMNDKFKETAEMLSEFRDVFGSNAGPAKVIEEAEKITGMSFAAKGAPEFARNKLSDLKTMSQTSGIDMQTMLQMDQTLMMGSASQMASMYGGDPRNYASLAAVQTPYIWQQSMAASNAQDLALANARNAQNGKFVQSFSMDEMASLSMQGMNSIMGEETIAIEAMFAAEKFDTMSKTTRTGIHTEVEKLGRAGSEEERQEIRDRLAGHMADAGIRKGQMLQAYGGDISALMNQMSVGGKDYIMQMASRQDRARAANYDIKRLSDTFNIAERYGAGADSIGAAGTLFEAVGTSGMRDISGLLADGASDAQINEYLIKNAAYFQKDTDFSALTGSIMGMDRKFLGEMGHAIDNDRMMKNQSSERDLIQARDKADQQFFRNRSLGKTRMSQKTILDAAAAGLMGHQEIEDRMVMEYMRQDEEAFKGAVTTINLKEGGKGFDVSDEQIAAMDKATKGQLMRHFGVENTPEGRKKIAAALGGDEGLNAMRNFLSSTGGAWSTDAKGNLQIADEEIFDKYEKNLSDMASARSQLILAGLDPNSGEGAEVLKGLEAKAGQNLDADLQDLQKKYGANFTNDPKTMQKVLEGVATNKGGGSYLQALQARLAADPTATRDAITEHMNELETKADKGDKKAKEELAAAKRAMAIVDNGGADNFLGYLELKTDDAMHMSLYRKD